MRFSVLCLLVLGLVPARLSAQIAASPFGASPFGRTPTKRSDASDKAMAALDLAKQAAKDGLTNVSFEAVKRAIGKGPPVKAVDLGGLLSNNPNSARVRMSSRQAPDDSRQRLAQKLLEVDKLWKELECDPAGCFELWQALVFPAERPSEAFIYSTEPTNRSISYSSRLSEPKPTTKPCGARCLYDWAKKAEKLAALNKLIVAREEMPAAREAVILLRSYIARDGGLEKLEELIGDCQSNLKPIIDGPNAPLLFSAVYSALEKLPKDSASRREFWKSLERQLSSSNEWNSNPWIRFAVAKGAENALEAGDQAAFEQYSQLALSPLSQLSTGNEEYVESTRNRYYAEAAEKALKAGHTMLGMRCMTLSGTVGARGNSSPMMTMKSFRKLMEQPIEERYPIFAEVVWDLPDLGLWTASAWAPVEKIPERFAQNFKNYRKKEILPIEQVLLPGSRSVSLIEWVMRDAITLGKSSEIESKIEKLAASKSDNAALARLVWQKAQNKPLDLTLVVDKSGDAPALRTSVTSERGALMPLDGDIAEAALRSKDQEMFKLGEDLAARLAGRGLKNRQNGVMHGRWLCALAAELKAGQPPQDTLKHFITANEFGVSNLMDGYPSTAIWLQNEGGAWEHQASTARSTLLLKYPLQGDFEIAFTAKDGTYAECGASFCGMLVDFLGYRRQFAVDTVGRRGRNDIAVESYSAGQRYNLRIKRSSKSGTITYFCNDEEVTSFKVPKGEYPFFGPQAMFHRQMALEDIKITGDVMIPRQLDLLNSRLVGWSSVFRGRKLPPIKPVPLANLDDEHGHSHDGHSHGEASASAGDVAESKTPASVMLPYDWHLVDGVLESVDHDARYETDKQNGIEKKKPWQPPNEQWVYYARPLCDGETLDFEFYFEQGAFSVSPTIDRIAVQIDKPALREHWITSDTELYGVSTTNRRDVMGDRKLGEIKLNPNSWNKAQFRREGKTITLSLNGTAVYAQQVDPNYRGRIGFLADQANFHVRVRNVILKGNWPEKVPEDLFAKSE